MRNNRKQRKNILLGLLLIIAAVCSGCQNRQRNQDKKEVPSLTIEVYDRNAVRTVEYGSVEDNRWTEQIKRRVRQKFGMEVNFQAVQRNADVQELKKQIKDGIDVFFVYDETEFQTMVRDGIAADLTDFINGKNSGIRELLGEERLSYGQVNGRQYAVNGKRLTTPLLCSFVRMDWLKKMGIELEEKDGHYCMTPSQLKQMLLAMKENGYCQYPYGIFPDYRCVQPIEGAFVAENAVSNDAAKSQTLEHYLCGMEGDRAAWKFLNDCYEQELILPDFADKSQEDLSQAIAEGECGFWSCLQWVFMDKGDAYTQLYEQDPEADIQPVEICHEDGTPAYYQKYRSIAAYVMVSSSCTQIPEALKYIEWLLGEEAHVLLWHGTEGEHWNYDENGVMQPIDSEYNYKSRIDVLDLDMLLLDDPCLAGEHGDNAMRQYIEIHKDSRCAEQYIEAGKIATGNGKWEEPYPGIIIESELLYREQIEENLRQFTIANVTAEKGSFDQVYDTEFKRLLEEGGQAVLDEKRAAFEMAAEDKNG